jgi:hypothetical protein
LSLHTPEQTIPYLVEHELGFPVLGFPAPRYQSLYRARAVPQTVVLDGDGRILFAQTGIMEALVDSVLQVLERHGGDGSVVEGP